MKLLRFGELIIDVDRIITIHPWDYDKSKGTFRLAVHVETGEGSKSIDIPERNATEVWKALCDHFPAAKASGADSSGG